MLIRCLCLSAITGLVENAGDHPSTSTFTGLKKDKRKRELDDSDEQAKKRVRLMVAPQDTCVIGFPWDHINHSCPYDSLLTVLLCVYQDFNLEWKEEVAEHNDTLQFCGELFETTSAHSDIQHMHDIRNTIRNKLGEEDPDMGPCGDRGGDLYGISKKILAVTTPLATKEDVCPGCDEAGNVPCSQAEIRQERRVVWTCSKRHWENNPLTRRAYTGKGIQEWLDAIVSQKSEIPCESCGEYIVTKVRFIRDPAFIAFIVFEARARIVTEIILPGRQQVYRLCGVIYFKPNHFVARTIDENGDVWYHDGVTMGNKTKYVNNILSMETSELSRAGPYRASLAIYTKFGKT